MNSSGYQILPPVLMYSAFFERQSAKVATERPKLFATCSGDIILSRENLNTMGFPHTLLVLLQLCRSKPMWVFVPFFPLLRSNRAYFGRIGANEDENRSLTA